MQKIRTRFIGAVLGAIGLARLAAAQTVHAPVPVAGSTQHILANGASAVISATTSDVDNGAVGNRFRSAGADAATVVASAARLCPGQSTTLTASGASARAGLSCQWQASLDGGLTWLDVAGASTTAYSATPTATTHYRLRTTGGGTSAPVTVTVEPSDAPTLAYSGSPFCQVSGAITAPVFSPAGGTFSGTPGLIINAATGVINLAGSTRGAHTVTYTSAGFCPATATTALLLVAAPAAAIAYSSSRYCQAAPSPVPTATPAGGTFTGSLGLAINAATGAIALAQSTPGVHTVTYLLAGACAAPASTTVRVEATAAPVLYNIITPNGDTKNDYLTVSLPSVTGYEMQVYNRWGKRVWQSTNPAVYWDAEGNPAGIYYYWIRFTDCSGQTQTQRSWVEVIK